jgi:Zn-dependent protease with chaperone function
VRVGERQFPKIHALVQRCAEVLQVPAPTVYVAPQIVTLTVRTLGTADDAMIALGSPMVDHLTEDELLFVIGRECGHIQNGHTVYLTALYFLTTAANLIVRFAAQPASLALNSWSRRAEVTADRAGLLCVRDLDVATAAMVKMSVGSQRLFSNIDVGEYIRQLDEIQGGRGRFHELFATVPYLPKRVQALRLFAQTTYFRSVINAAGEAGLSKEECDAKVADLLAVFR